MKMKRLFNRRSDGDLQTWDLEVVDNKYRVSSGKLGGKIVVNAWTECEGKNIGRANATTPDEQATAEAKALWTKKYNEGYRESEAELSEVTLFEPMLAKKYGDYKDDITFPVYAQPKLDGARCIAKPNGLFSRKGKPWITTPHIQKALEGVFKKHPKLFIDGELYADKLNNDFNQIIHLIKQSKPTEQDFKDSAASIKYFVYDCYFTDQPHLSFSARNQSINEILADIPEIQLVFTTPVINQAALDALYTKFLQDGYEGQMIRKDTPYENKRTTALLKRKEFVDAEYIITDIEEGIGNRAETAGAVICTNGKDTFGAGIRGNRSFAAELLKNRKRLIGKQATIRYQNLSPDNIPRFPVFLSVRDYE